MRAIIDALGVLRSRVVAWDVDPDAWDPRDDVAHVITLAIKAAEAADTAGPRRRVEALRSVRARLDIPTGVSADLRAEMDTTFKWVRGLLAEATEAAKAAEAELPPPAPPAPPSPRRALTDALRASRSREAFSAALHAYVKAAGFPPVAADLTPGDKVWAPRDYFKAGCRYSGRNSNWTLFRDEVGRAFTQGLIRDLALFDAFLNPSNPQRHLHPTPPPVSVVLMGLGRRN